MPTKKSKIIIIVCLLLIVGMAIILGPFVAPFMMSWEPSEKASLAGRPVPVKIKDVKENQPKVVHWRGKPILIIELTDAIKNDFQRSNEIVCKQGEESTPGQFLVMEQTSSYLGCTVKLSSNLIELPNGEKLTGFVDPCYGIKFDYFGRPLKSNFLPNGKNACSLKRLKRTPFKLIGEEIIVGL